MSVEICHMMGKVFSVIWPLKSVACSLNHNFLAPFPVVISFALPDIADLS